MLPYEYARSALKLGLKLEKKLGANPFKYGFIGATDTHTGLPTTREENYFGKYAKTEPSPKRHNYEVIPSTDPALRIITSQEQAGGMVAVWARENTRSDIVGAMKRREVYATTGSRITVRFFGGWSFEEADAFHPNYLDKAYSQGVPMGGDLFAGPEDQPPSFLVSAAKDPDGANLVRIQIVKGWLNSKGTTEEHVYDVAWSDDREPGADGKLPAVGNTVDIENATWKNTIGAPELIAVWEDPDFDPELMAFYYARVIEIPTPRWTAYEAKRFQVTMPDEVPMVVQERCYTSPIWYTP